MPATCRWTDTVGRAVGGLAATEVLPHGGTPAGHVAVVVGNPGAQAFPARHGRVGRSAIVDRRSPVMQYENRRGFIQGYVGFTLRFSARVSCSAMLMPSRSPLMSLSTRFISWTCTKRAPTEGKARSTASRLRQARATVARLSQQFRTRDEPQETKPSAEGFALDRRSQVAAAIPARSSPERSYRNLDARGVDFDPGRRGNAMPGRIELHRVDLGRRQTRFGGCLAGRELGPVAPRRAGMLYRRQALASPTPEISGARASLLISVDPTRWYRSPRKICMATHTRFDTRSLPGWGWTQ